MEKAGVIGSNFCEKKKERIRKKEFFLNPYPVNFEQEKLFHLNSVVKKSGNPECFMLTFRHGSLLKKRTRETNLVK